MFITQFTRSAPIKAFSTGSNDKVLQGCDELCSIKHIYDSYCGGEKLPIAREALYGDCSISPKSLEQARNLVERADNIFNSLSAETRQYFGNDVSRFIREVNNPKFEEKFKQLGLKAPDSVVDIPVVDNSTLPVEKPQSDVSTG